MNTEILMAASGVITVSACYVGWRFAKQAEGYYKALDMCREECDYWKGSSEQFKQINFEALEQNSDLISEVNRLSDLVATLQAKVPARNARGKFVAR